MICVSIFSDSHHITFNELTRLIFRFNTILTQIPSFLEDVDKLLLTLMQKSHGPRSCKTHHKR